ncbi:MAG TPA: hypothetical protein VFW96_19975 [Thermomicrobiales bacterium]|nr:hypothetical protein [Thermomicrobiales bacterium]
MRPEEYARIVLRRWWLIPTIAIVAAVVAFVVTNRQPRVYNSSTTLQVIGEPVSYWLDLTAKNQLAPLKARIASYQTAQEAVGQGDLGRLGLDPGSVQARLAVAHNPDNNTIQIAASDTDPARAAAIVNAVAAAFIRQIQADNQEIAAEFPRYMENGTPIKIDQIRVLQLDRATPATKPSAPRPKLNAAAAAILGVALALVLLFALEYFDDTLRTAEDVRRHLDLPVLVGVPNGAGRLPLGARRQRRANYGARDAE